MDSNTLNWTDTVILWATLVIAWTFGEGGRVIIAGAAGGLIRWLSDEHRRIRDGAIAVITGAIFAKYGTPIGLVLLNNWIGPIDITNDQIRDSTAFAMGVGGMTVGKLIMALFEKNLRKITSEEK
jgi:membrane associated rhomboid family serine protease